MKTMEEIINHAKSYGYVYQGSEIYNGLANTWDYGPLGAELKKNIKDLWHQEFVKKEATNVFLDSSIFLNSKVWEASGHIGGFADPLIDCKNCRMRHRADKLIEDFDNDLIGVDGWSNEKMSSYISQKAVKCPECSSCDFTDIRQFDLMFKTNMGVLEDENSKVYLRPETAQGIFINYKNILRTSRKKVPFGVGQIGKSFRNEITPGNFIFRTREFEQMELEFFCKPGEELKYFDYHQKKILNFLSLIGMNKENYRVRDHSKEELAHYSNKTSDVEYKFPFGYGELWGLSSRTDHDLKAHAKTAAVDMNYLDPFTNEKYIPYVIEPSVGVDRLFLAILCDALDTETLNDGDTRDVLRLNPRLAPIKIAVLPLVKKLNDKAYDLFLMLSELFSCEFDDSGKIGKRYRRQDVIGTPFCITYDYDSIDDESVTIRVRDSMEQKRIKIAQLVEYLNDTLGR